MAFTVTNSSLGIPRLVRGIDTPLGALAAANQAVQFTIPPIDETTLQRLVISLDGNLSGGTFLLEASLDGVKWFVVPALGSDITQSGAPDTPAVVASRFDVSALQGAQFRFGTTAFTSGSSNVWASIG